MATLTKGYGYIGRGIKRREDSRFLVGEGTYIDDIKLPGMLYAAILRSPYPHARIKSIEIDRASRREGVVGVLTGREVAEMSNPFGAATPIAMRHYSMAVEKVRFVGEPVAAVIATDRYIAIDALNDIAVEYEPLGVVVDAEEAMKPGAPLLHEEMGTNIGWHKTFMYGDVEGDFAKAERVVRRRITLHRFSATPIETMGCIADYDRAKDYLTLYASTQIPGILSIPLAAAIRMPGDRTRIITPDIGGSFGIKLGLPQMVLVALMSKKLGRPVKWIESRSEHLMALQHGSNPVYDVEAAVKNDGTILSLKIKMVYNVGAYMVFPEPEGILEQQITGCYRIPSYSLEAYAVMTNTCITGPTRGYGRQYGFYMLERMLDMIAEELGLDKAEIRFRNFIQPDEFPYTTPNGNIYDSGNYPELLRRALRLIDYENMRKRQEELRRRGEYIGIGFSTVIESGSPNFSMGMLISTETPTAHMSGNAEICRIKIEPTGKVIVYTGAAPQGQGIETATAQIAASTIGAPIEDIYVYPNFDSTINPFLGTSGTYGSRFAGIIASAVAETAKKVREKLARIAAGMLGSSPDEIEIENGVAYVRSDKQRSLPLQIISAVAYYHPLLLPEGTEPGIDITHVYLAPTANMPDQAGRLNTALTYASAAHACVVRLDAETGRFTIERYVVVDDCGTVINPVIVEGQIHGGTLHGIGSVELENIMYDVNGNLLTPTFMDYLIPSSVEAVDILVENVETPSPFTPLGSKGVGEGGAIAAPPAVANAVADALAFFKSEISFSDLHEEKIWRLIHRR